MTGTVRGLLSIAALTLLFPVPALASGGSASTSPAPPSQPPKTPEEQAIEHYNTGLKMRDKAWKLEAKSGEAPNEKKRAKIEAKIEKQYRNAIEQFQSAVFNNPRFYQAYGSLGYALRKTGQYEPSLEAYDKALGLEPGYSEAIEYRAEAYLGMNRLGAAKEAYIELFGMDREAADELLDAMKGWVERHQADPGDLTADAVSHFAGWVAERDELAAQTSSLSEGRKRGW